MGKLGGQELNPSSDIDIIFTYEDSGQTAGKEPISNQDFFTLLAKEIIGSFSDYSAEGILFRVDIRLRKIHAGNQVKRNDFILVYAWRCHV